MTFHLRSVAVATLVAWWSILPASAEIEKFVQPCEQKLCPFFRASLAIPKGWQEDQAATKKLNMQVLVPRGKTYDNAEAVIYATVTFNPEKKPIADFIAEDHARWRKSTPDVKISPLPDVVRTSGGEPFRVHEFQAPSRRGQPFERVATTTDTDKDGNPFLVGVVLTAESRKGLLGAAQAYLSVLKAY